MHFLYIAFLFTFLTTQVFAQDYRLELSLKANTIILAKDGSSPVDRSSWYPMAVSGEFCFFPLKKLGVGAFYFKSVHYGHYEYSAAGFHERSTFDYSMWGVSLQYSTNRERLFRAYVIARLGRFNLVEDFADRSYSNSALAYSAGAGVNLRLGPRFTFSIMEASFIKIGDEISKTEANRTGVFFQSGFSFKMSER